MDLEEIVGALRTRREPMSRRAADLLESQAAEIAFLNRALEQAKHCVRTKLLRQLSIQSGVSVGPHPVEPMPDLAQWLEAKAAGERMVGKLMGGGK